MCLGGPNGKKCHIRRNGNKDPWIIYLKVIALHLLILLLLVGVQKVLALAYSSYTVTVLKIITPIGIWKNFLMKKKKQFRSLEFWECWRESESFKLQHPFPRQLSVQLTYSPQWFVKLIWNFINWQLADCNNRLVSLNIIAIVDWNNTINCQ